MVQIYNKLVRDKIPEIIKAKDGTPVVRKLNDDEYLLALIQKLREETDEFTAENNLEELADILEVVQALAETLGKSTNELEEVRAKKAEARGGFAGRIFLESVN